jgi:hypothetical protein
MKLNNLIELLADLKPQTQIFLKNSPKPLPLGKVTIAADSCLLFPGNEAMTQQKLVQLVGHFHSLQQTIYLKIADKQIPIYGVQMQPEAKRVLLL